MGTADELVLYAVADGVATLTLNRPERNNAWTHAMEHRYFELLERAGDDGSVRAIVVTGAGKSFCPGMDVERLREESTHGNPSYEGRRPQTYPTTIPKPIVAAINGACAGIGLIQALVCDVRFAARGARFTTAFARRGLVAEHGEAWLLPRIVGLELALDLLLSARVFEADEARAIGLVSRVCEPGRVLDEAAAYARELAASCSPLSMAVIKHQVWGQEEGAREAARLFAIGLAKRLATHPDFAEGVKSFVERRPPAFAALPPGFELPKLGE